MKKIVVIMLLFFAFSLQANTINSVEKQNVKAQVELIQNEIPERGGQWHCTSTTTTHRIYSEDGNSYVESTVTITECTKVQ